MPITIKCNPNPIVIKSENSVNDNSNPISNSEQKAIKELPLADRDVQEYIKQVGIKVDYYSLDIKNSKKDPLYDEPLARKYSKAFKPFVYVSWPNPEFMVREDGTHTVYIATAYMARKEAEDINLNSPRPGDIIRFWNIPFFNNQATNGRDIDGAGMFFDVIEVKDDGHLFDTPYFTGFKMDIKRRSEFGAERLLGTL